MPRVAILADIHGNVPALEATLEDIDRELPDEVLVGGDLVGRGPQGSRVTEMIRERGWRTIRGNHEDYLLAFRKGDIPEAWRHAEVWSAARWMAQELAPEDVPFLDALPDGLCSEALPEVRLVHGTPRANNEGIGPWTSERSMCRHLDSVEENVLVCAHTHRPLDRQLPRGRVVNVGSVGLPFNNDPRAQYVILHGSEGALEVEFRGVDYDRSLTLDAYESTGFLAAGGATAALLALELRDAVPYLVPFLTWTEAQQRQQSLDAIDEFLSAYDPEHQREFFTSLAIEPRTVPLGEV